VAASFVCKIHQAVSEKNVGGLRLFSLCQE